MLSVEELFELEELIKPEIEDNLTGILAKLNRMEQLDDFLNLIGLENVLEQESGYQVHKNGKIIVIGQSDVKVDVLRAVARDLGIEKHRLEFYLDYEDAKTFNFRKLQWQPTYSLIMVGPMGHSGKAKGEFGSVISALENQDGYPPIVKLGSDHLKITKSDFKNKLQEVINAGKIVS